MKIGVIGLGHIGGTVARLWAKAGHELILSSRDSSKHEQLARELGPNTRLGTPEEAACEGEVVLLSIPLGEVPRLSEDLRECLRGKIVMDTCNPYPERDGPVAEEALEEPGGTGVWTANQLPDARIVRAFNSVHSELLASGAHRSGDPVGVPLASNDSEALTTVSRLVRDAGLGPVIVGDLSQSKLFDRDTPPYGSGASQSELKRMLRISKEAA